MAMIKQCVVQALHHYPVKSCRGVDVLEAGISPLGIEGDRELLVLQKGKPTNQARLAGLARVIVRRLDAKTFEFRVSEQTRLHQLSGEGAVTTVEYYGNAVSVVDQGDELAAFVSQAVGVEVRIASLKEPYRRAAPLEEFALIDGTRQQRFIDIAPILVTNSASLEDLNARLSDAVPMNRFRPNVVVDGLNAYAEDDVISLSGNGWQLLRATHCERCAVTCTDQESGERAVEPLATLKSYRHRENGFAGGVMFGAYMAVEGSGTIRVGDQLEVAMNGGLS